ncbi:maleylacetoacetate isomerase [Allopontixanthobacter sediminis]|uniref:Maleylacetoacetate isomerase n=1 Tax=Allopontixanthobacter sediminis TaxID=1689985 RepID=A0A845AXY0_9SPHN|nr:maleylacetoacetate isomerase [Allopontixanthobacter sediminis]MXP43100.1 maleylacetoacetate isomerase [Allopontixanthobacter sediminis]
MRLHGYFRSSTSYRLRIALNLKGLDYDYVPVNLVKSEQKSAAFTSRNPFASVPLLEAGGRDRAQSMALLEWLDEAYPNSPLLPAGVEDRYTVRELTYAIATEIHAPNNLPVLRYLADPLGHSQDEIAVWYRHWLARTLDPVEARLGQLGTRDFLLDAPGMFETVLLPQVYNARRFDFDFSPMPHIERIEAACLALEPFQRAHPDNQPDNPEKDQTV